MDSIDALIAALYGSISGAGGSREWDDLRSLFIDGALLVRRVKLLDRSTLAVSTVEEFIKEVTPKLQEVSFYEKEIMRDVDRFGCIAHIMSVYEARFTLDESKPAMRGINSIQLIKNDGHWFIVSLVWDEECPENVIPAHFLMPRTSI